ncbi:glutamyl-tRNA reductase [Marinicella litoralis]|uniref:Glutamyl-tRNA reductase n=1 Tax=Marinicella litoralis TaxID=644220 RepID=A0A4V6PXU6_9GAMM|nr:glutamyl-tRNA reductase [Marinicella litoralis]TDR18321.1 glutamyl-tRNA reductase [Marinicella litoralis]
MAICLLGINHKTADINIREKFTVAESDYQKHNELLLKHPAIDSAVVLSTCNRTEYYLSTPSIEFLKKHLIKIFEFDFKAKFVYLKSGHDCAVHLFSVAAGVDSLVIGETQIQGQVKRSFDEAKRCGVNSEINKLFQMAFKTAKMVRSETEIGRNPVSVAHCAVQLGRQIFGSLDQQKVLIIGAGETAELLVRYLINHHAGNMTICNRTHLNAQKLAAHFNAKTLSFESLESTFHEFDLIFTATASPRPIVSFNTAARALQLRKYKPIVMIDLSVPRDIEEDVKSLDDVFLYTVDDLQTVITKNMQRRESTIDEAGRIIHAEAELFGQWLQTKKHHDLLKQYQLKIENIKDTVVAKHMSKDLPDDQANKLTTIAHQVSKKMSHHQMIGMKKIIESGNEDHIKLIAQLFDLEINDDA